MNLSRADRVYETLKQGILDGSYLAGERLREEELAQRLAVSRTPVREALQRLTAEGILIAAPGRGLEVAEVTPEQIAELYVIFGPLEALSARLAAQHIGDLDLARMAANLRQMAEAEGEGLTEAVVALNRSFHEIIWTASRNHTLYRLMVDLRASRDRSYRHTLFHPGRAGIALAEHSRLFEALQARDSAAAEAAALRHVQNAQAARLEMIISTGSKLEVRSS